jgi:hypothetical protein
VSGLFYAQTRAILRKTSASEPIECKTPIDLINATSIVDIDPTPFQIITENYRKAHVRIDGLPIVIETPQGVTRRKRNPDGSIIWARPMPYSYGYINNTMDADFDPVDVFIGDFPNTKIIYIMDQMHHEHHNFDEHKVFIWFRDRRHAKNCYYDSFDKKKEGKKRLMAMVGMHLVDFKEWLKTNGTMTPISQQDLHDLI